MQDAGLDSSVSELRPTYSPAGSVNNHQIAHDHCDVRVAIKDGEILLHLVFSPNIVMVSEKNDLSASIREGTTERSHNTLVPLLSDNPYPIVGKTINNGARVIL